MIGNFKEEIARIRAFVFDVDGVFTDARILITPSGEFLREYNMRDGLAVVRAIQKGYPIAIISGGRGNQLRQRMEGLGIRHIYMGQESKLEALLHFAAESGVPAVRIAVAPSDADSMVKGVVHYVSAFGGGRGCVRDIVEQVLRARGDWFTC